MISLQFKGLSRVFSNTSLEASGIMNFTLFLSPSLKSDLPPSQHVYTAQFQAFTEGFPVSCLSRGVWRWWSLGVGSPAPQDGLALRVGAACPGVGSVGGGGRCSGTPGTCGSALPVLGWGWERGRCSGIPGTFQQHHLVSQGRRHMLCSVMVTRIAEPCPLQC